MSKSRGELIVALDVATFQEARVLIDQLRDVVDIFKVGSQLFTACGPVVIRHLIARGKKVFLDLKFYDIPNTVASAVEAAVNLSQEVHEIVEGNKELIEANRGIFMSTLHILGGEEMLQRAADAARETAKKIGVIKPLLLGITVLTSQKKEDNIHAIVCQRVEVALKSGLDGVVASSQEVSLLRAKFGEELIIVTPGIRPKGSQVGDQKRVATPSSAILDGSDYLVVGRPIVQATDPLQAAKDILAEIVQAKKECEIN